MLEQETPPQASYSMSDPLHGIRLKLQRAEQQLKSLNAEVVAFLESKPYGMPCNFNENTGELTVVAAVREPCPAIWGVSVGEILHNLRSSLDQLVWQLVILQTGKPPGTKKTQFPIFQTQTEYQKSTKVYLHGVGSRARALIESVQPFSTGEGVRSALWQLHELSNFDKHRTLHLTGAMLRGAQLIFPPMVEGVVLRGADTRVQVEGPFEDGAELVKIKFSGPRYPFNVPKEEAKVEGGAIFNIGFDRSAPAAGGALVLPTMLTIGSRVRDIVERTAKEICGLDL